MGGLRVVNATAISGTLNATDNLTSTAASYSSGNGTELPSTVTASNHSANATTELLANWFAFKSRFAMQCVLVFIVLLCVILLCFFPGSY